MTSQTVCSQSEIKVPRNKLTTVCFFRIFRNDKDVYVVYNIFLSFLFKISSPKLQRAPLKNC